MKNSLDLKVTGVFERNKSAYDDPNCRYIVNIGGSRSSKTYSILQLLLLVCLTNPGIIVSVVRKSFPSLRGSVMRDFFQMLESLDYYNERLHNKSENIYRFPNGSIIEFFSLDDSQKVRGRKRDVLYINEANELEYESYVQLILRTTGKCFIDMNPSDHESWIYELSRDQKATKIHSTYKDNPYLGADQIQEIEKLVLSDYNYYRIYALGEPPTPNSRIYTHFQSYLELPLEEEIESVNYGLDFGYTHPTSIVKSVRMKSGKIFAEELLYESNLTTADLIQRMKTLPELKSGKIYADSARPESIEEIKRAGFSITPADKAVKPGIDHIKSCQIFVHKNSTNIWKEYRLYSWKESREGVVSEEPVKLHDDALDALRYAIYSSQKKQSNPAYFKFY